MSKPNSRVMPPPRPTGMSQTNQLSKSIGGNRNIGINQNTGVNNMGINQNRLSSSTTGHSLHSNSHSAVAGDTGVKVNETQNRPPSQFRFTQLPTPSSRLSQVKPPKNAYFHAVSQRVFLWMKKVISQSGGSLVNLNLSLG